MKWADTVRELRKKYGLSQRGFAKAYDLSRRAIEQWEQEEREPPEWSQRMFLYYVENNPPKKGEK